MIKLGIVVLASIVIFSPFLIFEAFAELGIAVRMSNYEITQTENATSGDYGSYVSRLGLPEFLDSGGENFMPYLSNETASMIEIESGILTYSFDKNSCVMKIYNTGFMNQTTLLINDSDWIIRVAPNGTENWTNIPENTLGCTVITDFQPDFAIINSTKSNVNATLSEVYTFDGITGLKHDLYFTNNNSAWNNHKFAWSNNLMDVPNSFAIQKVVDQINGTMTQDLYSVHSGSNQPTEFGGFATVLDYVNSETIQYSQTEFIWNGTVVVDGFLLYNANGLPKSDRFEYHFKDGLDSLSTVKFTSNPDQTLDVFVDYANVNQPLGIGQTLHLDPTTTFTTVAQRGFDHNFGSECGLENTGFFGFGFDLTGSTASVLIQSSGSADRCIGNYGFFDISSISDDPALTITRWTFAINVTSGSCSGSGCQFFPMSPSQVYQVVGQDISLLNLVDFQETLSVICGSTGGCVMDTTTLGNFRNWCPFSLSSCQLGGGFGVAFDTTGLRVINVTSFGSKHFTDFEAQLQSGKDFYQLVVCQFPRGGGCGYQQGTTSTRFNSMAWQRTDGTSFFEVAFEFFDTPSAPLNPKAIFSASPDECLVEWTTPASDGGRIITGYNILRSTNSGTFTTLVADSASILTSHTDSVIAGESHKYRISGINVEGIGDFAETPASCGIPAIADPPTLDLLTGNVESAIIQLNWSPPAYDGALPIDGYRIERSTGTGFTILVNDTASTTTFFNDIGVQLTTEHTYRVLTINSLGVSLPSNELSFTLFTPTGGAGVGSPVEPLAPPAEPVFPQEEFDQALAEALAQIPPQQLTVIETVVRVFFEFAVVDDVHENVRLNSFLDNERLGIRWSSGQDIVVVSASPAPSPFIFTFEQLPVIKRGSGAVVSTDFIVYNLNIPRNQCVDVVSIDCVEKVRYEVPITVNAVLNGTNVSDVGTVTVDLREGQIDPILLIILATFGIPIIGAIVQRSRGRSAQVPLRKLVSG